MLRNIDTKSGGLETLDSSLSTESYPKSLKNKTEKKLPKIGVILQKLRDEEMNLSVYELELLFRSSGNLRLIFNYWSALSFKTTSEKMNPGY